MTRLDRSRLDSGRFPYRCQIQTRFSDMDKLDHINNVAVADILQEGRLRFVQHCGLMLAREREIVVASSNIEFAAELLYPDPVEVAVGILEIGRSSFRFAELASQNGRVGAYAEFAMVARHEGAAALLPDTWRALLEGLKVAFTAPGPG